MNDSNQEKREKLLQAMIYADGVGDQAGYESARAELEGQKGDGYPAVQHELGEDGVKTLVEDRNNAQKRITELDAQLVDCQATLHLRESQRDTAEESESVANAKVKELEAQLADLKDFAYNRAPKIAAEQADRQMAELRAQLAEKQRIIREHEAATVRLCGQIDDAVARLVAAEARAEAMRKALEMVEWRASGAHYQCLWCHNIKMLGHKSDCARQAALAPTPAESEVKE